MSASVSEGLPAAPTPRSSVLAVLQRIGRSLMMPIAVLPAAALLLRLGQPDLLGKYHFVNFSVLGQAGGILLDNLPLLFAIGVAIGFARRSDGSTALAAAVGYLVFNAVTMTMFAGSSLKGQVLTTAADFTAPKGPKALFEQPLPNPTWVIGGIIMGVTAALLWQRFHRVKLVSWLAFFGGRRFVPIVTAFAGLIIGIIFGFVWPPIGQGINNLGDLMTSHGAIGAGIYGAFNRLLLPFGLHHIINSIVWFVFGTFQGPSGAVHGDLNRFFAGDPSAGTFMAGFFPVMMFGLPAACLAMWRHARPERRKVVGGFLLSAALTSLITGVTEPIEFSFLFVAPLLYAVHVVLTGVSLWLAAALGIHDGFGFSAGLIDYILNYTKSNTAKPLLLLLLGAIYAVVYYAVFSFLIKRLNILTPGREPEEAAAEEVTQREPVQADVASSPSAARASAAEPAGPAEAAPRAEPGDRGTQPG
jgi:N-acetylglucosamine PTS system EIICBA or EIICB component